MPGKQREVAAQTISSKRKAAITSVRCLSKAFMPQNVLDRPFSTIKTSYPKHDISKKLSPLNMIEFTYQLID
ncbi:hypothetical protein [Vibrio fluvialis]|uniref:hypothetical protein n=1 Tax=Vibrio fluvialis TaxID=676 RepID=UPI0013029B6E|nr:hypothetical protein [Vibrio fluvialis]